MKKFIRYLMIVFVIYCGFIVNQSKGYEGERLPFDCQYKIIEYSPQTGLATLELTIIQFYTQANTTDCDKLKVVLSTVDGLEYFGEDTWEIEIDVDNPFVVQLDIKIPVNDTSGMLVNLKCNLYDLTYPNYIMAVNDTLLFTQSDPLYQHPLQQYGTPEEESLINQRLHEEAIQRYAEKQKKLLAHKPKQTTGPIAPFTRADSLFYDSLTDGGKRTYAKMKYLELQGPSTNRYGESALIDNYGFARDSGQTYFYRVRSVPTDKLRAESRRIRDSILAVNPPNVYDVIVDLRNSEDYLYFKDKVDLIEKTDREGYYRIECNKSVITEIEQRKIKYRRTHRPSWIKSDSAKAERRKRVEKVKKK